MKIRPYEEKDRENVRFVCLNSEGPCDMNATGQFFILTTYCDYYIECEPENCFVAADENDRAVGYIICTEDYDTFRPRFLEEYLPRLDKLGPHYRISAKNSTRLQEKHKAEYPAHMHIDLLPEYQRMGIGSQLVDTLAAHLKAKKIPGVMLTVGSSNQVGQNFYRKYGFTQIDKMPGDIAFGLKINL